MLSLSATPPVDRFPEHSRNLRLYLHEDLGKRAVRMSNESQKRIIPPMFELGDGDNRLEYIEDGQRTLAWQLTGNEDMMGQFANWQVLPHEFGDGVGYLRVPEATRNARSILSGTEAYTGEKARVVEAACTYLKSIKRELDSADMGFSWKSVGVTPEEGTVFVAPPHTLVREAEVPKQWAEEIVSELRLLLTDDNRNQILIGMLEEAIR